MSHAHSEPHEPQLAPPGEGLPPAEQFIIRRLVFPFLRLRLSREKSLQLFEKSGQQILNLAKPLTEEEITEKVLIKRLPGMEDSSRNWSVEMTMEHIQIVSVALVYIIKKLEANRPLNVPVRTEDVKPNGGLGRDRVRAFENFLVDIPKRLDGLTFTSKATHPHPWFGEMPAIDWLRLLAFHQNLHRKQIERILNPAPC